MPSLFSRGRIFAFPRMRRARIPSFHRCYPLPYTHRQDRTLLSRTRKRERERERVGGRGRERVNRLGTAALISLNAAAFGYNTKSNSTTREGFTDGSRRSRSLGRGTLIPVTILSWSVVHRRAVCGGAARRCVCTRTATHRARDSIAEPRVGVLRASPFRCPLSEPSVPSLFTS